MIAQLDASFLPASFCGRRKLHAGPGGNLALARAAEHHLSAIYFLHTRKQSNAGRGKTGPHPHMAASVIKLPLTLSIASNQRPRIVSDNNFGSHVYLPAFAALASALAFSFTAASFSSDVPGPGTIAFNKSCAVFSCLKFSYHFTNPSKSKRHLRPSMMPSEASIRPRRTRGKVTVVTQGKAVE
jgi:hypothetical protein